VCGGERAERLEEVTLELLAMMSEVCEGVWGAGGVAFVPELDVGRDAGGGAGGEVGMT
jgi:hypothetical protein